MTADDRSVRLFSLGGSIEGEPNFIKPATFAALGAEELKDIERWLKKEPELLGEEICIIASQFANWDKTTDRPDLLGLDRDGKLVVVEIKRDKSGRNQDLQAIRYCSYAATLSSDDVVELFRTYRRKERGEDLTAAEASEELGDFIEGDIAELDADDTPRMILTAAGFQPGVTSTVLWLRRSFAMDVSCVQITPYELRGEVVLTSTTLIPLPEAATYEVKMQTKRLKAASKKGSPINWEDATAFIESVPLGRWTSYKDVAIAAGSPNGQQAIGRWLGSSEPDLPLVYRVLNMNGKVNRHWAATNPNLPQTPEEVRNKLIAEGIVFQDDKADQEQRWRAENWAGSEEESVGEEPGDNGVGATDQVAQSRP